MVTGGSSGIGLGVVKELAHGPNNTIISMSRQEARIASAQQQLTGLPGRVIFEVGSVTDADDCQRLAAFIDQQFGHLDCLVNSAGSIAAGGIEVCDVHTWEQLINANLTGTFRITKALVPLLKKGSFPSIVNISSVCSLRPCSSIAYSVTKAGVDMFTKCLAKELAPFKVRVNAVNPGVVRSNLQISAGIVNDYEEFLANMEKLHPLGRNGDPSDVAKMICFLGSVDTSWITGAIVSVDGGRAL